MCWDTSLNKDVDDCFKRHRQATLFLDKDDPKKFSSCTPQRLEHGYVRIMKLDKQVVQWYHPDAVEAKEASRRASVERFHLSRIEQSDPNSSTEANSTYHDVSDSEENHEMSDFLFWSRLLLHSKLIIKNLSTLIKIKIHFLFLFSCATLWEDKDSIFGNLHAKNIPVMIWRKYIVVPYYHYNPSCFSFKKIHKHFNCLKLDFFLELPLNFVSIFIILQYFQALWL